MGWFVGGQIQKIKVDIDSNASWPLGSWRWSIAQKCATSAIITTQMQLQDRRPLKNKWDGTFFPQTPSWLCYLTPHRFHHRLWLEHQLLKNVQVYEELEEKVDPRQMMLRCEFEVKEVCNKRFFFSKDHQSSRIVISVSIMVVSCSCLSLSLFAREKATWGSRRGNPPSGGSLPQIILETLELFTIVLLEAKKAVTIDFMSPVDETGLNEGPPVGQITHIIRPHENYRCRRPIFATVLFSDYWEIEMVFRGFLPLVKLMQ